MNLSAPVAPLAPSKKGGDAGGNELAAEYGSVAAWMAEWDSREVLLHSLGVLRETAGFWLGLSALQVACLYLGAWMGAGYLALPVVVALTLEALRQTGRTFVDHSRPQLGAVVAGAPVHIFRAGYLSLVGVLTPALSWAAVFFAAGAIAMFSHAYPVFGELVIVGLALMTYGVLFQRIWSRLARLVLAVPALALSDRPFVAYSRALVWLRDRRPRHYFEVLPLALLVLGEVALAAWLRSPLVGLGLVVGTSNLFLLHATHTFLRDYSRWAVYVRRKSVGLTTLDADMLLPQSASDDRPPKHTPLPLVVPGG